MNKLATDIYGKCCICGQQLGTATAGHVCVIDVSKLPKYYSEAEYDAIQFELKRYKSALRKIVCLNIPMPDGVFNLANDALEGGNHHE